MSIIIVQWAYKKKITIKNVFLFYKNISLILNSDVNSYN